MMRNKLAGFAAIVLPIQILTLSAAPPAAAISVELAKKCRDMAIQTHPPAPAGTSPYAAAERTFFTNCIAKNGEMGDNNGPPPPPPKAPSAGQQ
jgi:hypothetical protein